MIPIHVCVHAEHLPVDVAAVGKEVFWEAGGFTDPVRSCELGERGAETGGTSWNGCSFVGRGGGTRRIGHSPGHSSRLDNEAFLIVAFGFDPLTDKLNILWRREFHGISIVVEPRVGMTLSRR